MGQLIISGQSQEENRANPGIAAAKPKADVTFEEYKERVIGTAWESRGNVGNGKVLVAVGVK